MIEQREFYIDGKWVKPAKANDFHVIDAATEEPCAVISLGSRADVDAAVAAARRAFASWSATPREQRIAMVEKLLPILNARVPQTGARFRWKWARPSTWRSQARRPARLAPRGFRRGGKDFRVGT